MDEETLGEDCRGNDSEGFRWTLRLEQGVGQCTDVSIVESRLELSGWPLDEIG